ncbi:Coenzyme F420 hydrogenase/dehydrogenase, beta subunit C-terminal domain [Modestobacter sp. SYSU DS0875]
MTGTAELGADRVAPALAAEVARVVAAGNCSGCGACVQLDRALEMRLDPAGRSRPVPVELSTRRPPAGDVAAAFARSCPGRRVEARAPEGSVRHDLLGPVVAAWEAWATDPGVRHAGSSGGVLTALTAWLVSTGEVAQVVGAQADPADPARTVAVAVTDRTGALAAAGSRYAPVANAAHPAALDPRGAVVGKPCEVSALRALTGDTGAPLLMSFFCAGVPAQTATTDLVRSLGVGDGERVTDLRYRGRGWPGEFTAVTDQQTVRASYDESWGRYLGPTTQWRCKLCPDGTGESADLVAGDFWHADDRGYPVFADDAGRSVLIARTRRGRELVDRAVAAGVLTVGPVDLDTVVAVQPLQADRRRTLAGRLLGNALAGRPVPRYRGFGLLGHALRSPRDTVRAARGTRSRVRREVARARG